METVVKEVKWFVDFVCANLPQNYKEDVKQDIYLQILLDIKDRDDLLIDDKIELCFKNIPKYRHRFSYRYKRAKEINFENMDRLQAQSNVNYRLSFDMDKIFEEIVSPNQRKLLRFILENGIDVTYKEISNELGYSSKTQSMWTLRALLQNMKNILNGDGLSVYDHKRRYLRYRIKKNEKKSNN